MAVVAMAEAEEAIIVGKSLGEREDIINESSKEAGRSVGNGFPSPVVK